MGNEPERVELWSKRTASWHHFAIRRDDAFAAVVVRIGVALNAVSVPVELDAAIARKPMMIPATASPVVRRAAF